jgi:hypothetical protein
MNKETMPDLLKEKQNRLFFLKAILLGIQYGESEKRMFHKQMVEQEIAKIELNSPRISTTPISPSSLLSNPIANMADQSLQQKTALSIQQYEHILNNLYVKRVNLQSQIGNLSANAYSKTLTLQQNKMSIQQIQALRAMLAITLKEIEKYTLLLNSVKKMNENPKVSSQESIMKKNQVRQFVEPPKLQQTTMSSFQKPILPKMEIKEEMVEENEEEDPEDFMKELQKTFGSLSSLLTSD